MNNSRNDANLLGFWYAVYSRRRLALLIVGSALGAALLLSLVLPSVYEARAVIFVPAQTRPVAFLAPPAGSVTSETLAPAPSEDANGPYIGVLRGRTIAEQVAAEYPGKTAADLMRKDIDIVLTDEYLLEIYARDRDPEVAAGVANAYVKYFNEAMDKYSMQSRGEVAGTIDSKLETHRRSLDEQMGQLRKFQQDNKIADLTIESDLLSRRRSDFAVQLQQAEVEQRDLAQKYDSVVQALNAESIALEADALSQFLGSNTYLSRVKSDMVALEMQLAAARSDVTESHPDVVALQKSYDAAQHSVEVELTRIVNASVKSPDLFYENLRRQLVEVSVARMQLDARVQALSKVITDLDNRIQRIPELRVQIDRMQSEINYHKQIVEMLQMSREESTAQSKRNPAVAVVVDQAVPPKLPAFPVVWLNLLVALLVGSAVAIFYVLFVDYLDATRGERILRLLRAVDATAPQA
jgi:uncharacterized protein involved in exopolysaccharide biosynthesis